MTKEWEVGGLTCAAALAAVVIITPSTAWGQACTSALPACNADVAPAGGNGSVNIDDLVAVISNWGINTAPNGPRPPGDCAPLPNGNCVVNIDDLVQVINKWGACAAQTSGACILPNNTCTVNTQAQCNAAGGLGWANGATCTDSDGDRIPNAFELNNCLAPNGAFAGTNPNLADTDGDLLKDGDELFGTAAGLNLPAMGANPLRKNLMMEVDWFDDADGGSHSHRPSANAVNLLIAAFANSTVANTCGGTGITLIIDYGQGGAFTGGNLIPGGDTIVTFDAELNTYKAANFAANRHGYFYYSLHCHRYNTASNNSSGVAELNGDDHIVSLQTALSDSNVSKTMMHEFGHNLNLRHGGNVDTNYKPNYNSVMNYRYQFPGTDLNCNAVGDSGLDYSRGVNISLNESSLSEAAGVCGSTPIDWNDGGISPSPITANINCPVGVFSTCGVTGGCADSTCTVLNDFNDWAAIVFTGLNHADFAPPEIITCDAPRALPER